MTPYTTVATSSATALAVNWPHAHENPSPMLNAAGPYPGAPGAPAPGGGPYPPPGGGGGGYPPGGGGGG